MKTGFEDLDEIISLEGGKLIVLASRPAMGNREDHRPIFSDFYKSYSLVQDADVIMFLYRDEYYIQETENKNIAEVIIAKNRNGKCNTVKILSLPKYCKFGKSRVKNIIKK